MQPSIEVLAIMFCCIGVLICAYFIINGNRKHGKDYLIGDNSAINVGTPKALVVTPTVPLLDIDTNKIISIDRIRKSIE